MRFSNDMKPKRDIAATNGTTDTASEASTPAPLRKKPKPGEGQATMPESKPSEDVPLVRGEVHLRPPAQQPLPTAPLPSILPLRARSLEGLLPARQPLPITLLSHL